MPVAGIRIALLVLAIASQPVARSAGNAELQSARITLGAARDALSAASVEFRSMLSQGGASESETKDYLAYLGRLKRSVSANCRVVLDLKLEIGDSSPEPGCNPDDLKPAGPVSFPGERTEEERIAGLEGQLGKSMSEFDELLLREMDELQRKRSGSPDESGGSGTADGEGEGATSADGGAEPDGRQGSRQGQEQIGNEQPQGEEVASQAEPGEQQTGAHGGSRQSGADGSRTATRDAPPSAGDDDIVARQLREAAEQETDPVLREKLWEEYRRYKEKQKAQPKNLN